MEENQSVVASEQAGVRAGTSPPSPWWLSWGKVIVLGLVAIALAGAGTYWFDPWHWRGRQVDATSQWQAAHQAIRQRDINRAHKLLASCLEAWPLNAEAHFLAARTCRRAQDFTGWQSHLMAADRLQWPHRDIELELQLYQAQTGNVW